MGFGFTGFLGFGDGSYSDGVVLVWSDIAG
jgi:ketopantoate hydroxymethyltransferase